MKVLVLSDLHLGARASRAPGQWDEIARIASEFDRVILNGDTLDRCYEDPRGDAKASELIADAKKFCASRNGPPEILSGNHDPVISDTHWIYDAQSETLIFHGDCILDYTHWTKKVDRELRDKLIERWEALGGRPADFQKLHDNYREVQREYLPIIHPHKDAKTVFQYALSVLYPPRRPFDIVHYWMKAPERALETAKGFDRPLKRVVVGHTHRPGHWVKDGIEIFNTGSHMPFSKAFAVCIEDSRVSYVLLDELASKTKTSLATGSKDDAVKLVEFR